MNMWLIGGVERQFIAVSFRCSELLYLVVHAYHVLFLSTLPAFRFNPTNAPVVSDDEVDEDIDPEAFIQMYGDEHLQKYTPEQRASPAFLPILKWRLSATKRRKNEVPIDVTNYKPEPYHYGISVRIVTLYLYDVLHLLFSLTEMPVGSVRRVAQSQSSENGGSAKIAPIQEQIYVKDVTRKVHMLFQFIVVKS